MEPTLLDRHFSYMYSLTMLDRDSTGRVYSMFTKAQVVTVYYGYKV